MFKMLVNGTECFSKFPMNGFVQIADDVLNVTGTREELGKNPNTDAERGKKTYPTFYGAEGARKLADDCVDRAIARLSSFGPTADPLRELARYITSRNN